MPDADEGLVEPGYRPEYTGDRSLGNVGSGRELGANLYALYRAGRNELPALAAIYAQLTYLILPVRVSLQVQFDRPGLGPEPAHERLLELREEIHDILRENCRRMVEVGQALVKIADAYAATDQTAADEFGRMLGRNSAEFNTSALAVPDPPGPDDEIPARPY